MKVAYRKPRLNDYEQYVHEKAPIENDHETTTSSRQDFEKVKDSLHKVAVELELNILAVLQYDFEFKFPFEIVHRYFSILRKSWNMGLDM